MELDRMQYDLTRELKYQYSTLIIVSSSGKVHTCLGLGLGHAVKTLHVIRQTPMSYRVKGGGTSSAGFQGQQAGK